MSHYCILVFLFPPLKWTKKNSRTIIAIAGNVDEPFQDGLGSFQKNDSVVKHQYFNYNESVGLKVSGLKVEAI